MASTEAVRSNGAVALAIATLCGASSTAALAQSAPDTLDEVVVTGFRASLANALSSKRRERGITDTVNAEGIADFPDLNLAESLQRISGVAIDREAGEGRSITVRGLSPDFTRVRIGGMEALATSGGKDTGGGTGGANRGRGFDFQLFASELFSRITVRKTQSSEVEEGSLGATVDLLPGRPFDRPGPLIAGAMQYGFNDLSRSFDPRGSLVVSNTWDSDRIGVLVSAAFSTRTVVEEGSSSGRWENPSVTGNSAGCFKLAGACDIKSGGYSLVNSAWHPRIPRYERLASKTDRLGVTGSAQWRPTPGSLIGLNVLYARTEGERFEDYLEAYLSRPGVTFRSGKPDTDNQLISGVFDDVDVRAESRHDILTSDFYQAVFDYDFHVGDNLNVSGAMGRSRSLQDNPVQTTISFDRYDVDGYRYAFSDQRSPELDYGFDVSRPENWRFEASNAAGDASYIRLRPNATRNQIDSARLDLAYDVAPGVAIKGGALIKSFMFETTERRRNSINGISEGAVALPSELSIPDISTLVAGFGRGLAMPGATPRSWLAPDVVRVAELLGVECDCINTFGDFRLSSDNQRGSSRDVIEDSYSTYIQSDFDRQIMGLSLRADAGVRYAHTKTTSGGFVGSTFVRTTHEYEDILPSLNLALEPSATTVIRLGASKVIARPQLPFLTPGGSISNTARTLTVGNPDLAPIRATTIDLNFEWYPGPDALISLGVFHKDLQSYVQPSLRTVAFKDSGLPVSLLANGNTSETLFTLSQLVNTRGGSLDGVEVSVQSAFRLLPAPFDRFGGMANLTVVESDVTYLNTAASGAAVETVLPLVGLSPTSWNATIYYEGDRFTARVSVAYRDSFLTGVPGGNGNDARGKAATSNIDFAARWQVSDRVAATFEGLNLTDEFEDRWISTERDNSEEYTHTGRQFLLGLRYSL